MTPRPEPVVVESLTDDELCAELECTPEFLDWARAQWGDDGPEQFLAVRHDPKTEERAAQMEAVRLLEAQGNEVGPPEGYTAAEWEELRPHLPPPSPLTRIVAFKLPTQLAHVPAHRRPRSRSPRSARRRGARSSSAASRDGPGDPDPDLDPAPVRARLGVEAAA